MAESLIQPTEASVVQLDMTDLDDKPVKETKETVTNDKSSVKETKVYLIF